MDEWVISGNEFVWDRISMCVHVYTHVCVCVCGCVCMHVCMHVQTHAHACVYRRENSLYPKSQVSSRKPASHPTLGIKPSEFMNSRWRSKANSIHVKEEDRKILRPRCNNVKAAAAAKSLQSRTHENPQSKGRENLCSVKVYSVPDI